MSLLGFGRCVGNNYHDQLTDLFQSGSFWPILFTVNITLRKGVQLLAQVSAPLSLKTTTWPNTESIKTIVNRIWTKERNWSGKYGESEERDMLWWRRSTLGTAN